jgi:hypothetical protein
MPHRMMAGPGNERLAALTALPGRLRDPVPADPQPGAEGVAGDGAAGCRAMLGVKLAGAGQQPGRENRRFEVQRRLGLWCVAAGATAWIWWPRIQPRVSPPSSAALPLYQLPLTSQPPRFSEVATSVTCHLRRAQFVGLPGRSASPPCSHCRGDAHRSVPAGPQLPQLTITDGGGEARAAPHIGGAWCPPGEKRTD